MSNCPKSYSYEHSYVPLGNGKLKCVFCGNIINLKYPVDKDKMRKRS